MKITIDINTDNDAFVRDAPGEFRRIMKGIGSMMALAYAGGFAAEIEELNVMDSFGNTAGKATITR